MGHEDASRCSAVLVATAAANSVSNSSRQQSEVLEASIRIIYLLLPRKAVASSPPVAGRTFFETGVDRGPDKLPCDPFFCKLLLGKSSRQRSARHLLQQLAQRLEQRIIFFLFHEALL